MGMVFLAVFLILPDFAQTAPLNLGLEYVDYTGLANTDIRMIIAKIIRAALGLVGLIAVGFTIYGGYMYMTAGGNEEKIATAKKILKNMVIGLAIILSALSIVQFIISAIYSDYAAKYGQEQPTGGPGEEFIIGGFLGSVIESHYPMRNAIGIPRNTKIVVTFKQKIKPDTLILDTNGDGVYGNLKDKISDQINSDNIKIYATVDKEAGALGMKPEIELDDVYAYLSEDGRTIVLKPKNYLGDWLKEVNYTVDLKGGVKLLDGTDAFKGMGGHYSWQFTVSTEFDLTPPQVESIIPLPSSQKYPRNIIVEMNFNEAVDPISASGFYEAGVGQKQFQNIAVTSSLAFTDGEYKITNQYKTVEFVPKEPCGTNSCGLTVYCLPADKSLAATVRSATVDSANAPQAQITGNLYNGVVDMAGNSLNGGGEMGRNKKTNEAGYKTMIGQPTDNFWWQFSTSAQMNTSSPILQVITPSIKKEGVLPSSPLTMKFNKLMLASAFQNILLKTNKDFNVWYTPQSQNYDLNEKIIIDVTQIPNYTMAELKHGDFWQATSTSESAGAMYYPFIPSTVTDIYQNCFYKAEGPGCSASELKVDNPSCYNGAPGPGASTCEAGQSCPFSPAPK